MKFEYLIEFEGAIRESGFAPNYEGELQFLNLRGGQGWELAAINGKVVNHDRRFYFKRAISE